MALVPTIVVARIDTMQDTEGRSTARTKRRQREAAAEIGLIDERVSAYEERSPT
jgi:hypothetical protein